MIDDRGPEEADVTALALAPQFEVDGTAFAGTAQGMLFGTSEGEETWRYLYQTGQDVADQPGVGPGAPAGDGGPGAGPTGGIGSAGQGHGYDTDERCRRGPQRP